MIIFGEETDFCQKWDFVGKYLFFFVKNNIFVTNRLLSKMGFLKNHIFCQESYFLSKIIFFVKNWNF